MTSAAGLSFGTQNCFMMRPGRSLRASTSDAHFACLKSFQCRTRMGLAIVSHVRLPQLASLSATNSTDFTRRLSATRFQAALSSNGRPTAWPCSSSDSSSCTRSASAPNSSRIACLSSPQKCDISVTRAMVGPRRVHLFKAGGGSGATMHSATTASAFFKKSSWLAQHSGPPQT